jgi:hypothetical protein
MHFTIRNKHSPRKMILERKPNRIFTDENVISSYEKLTSDGLSSHQLSLIELIELMRNKNC